MNTVKVADASGRFHVRQNAPQRAAQVESDPAYEALWWESTEESREAAAIRGAALPEISPWERAIRLLIEERGETSPTGKPYREVYADSSCQEIYDRTPARPPAPKLTGDAHERARRLADTEVSLAKLAHERAVHARAKLD